MPSTRIVLQSLPCLDQDGESEENTTGSPGTFLPEMVCCTPVYREQGSLIILRNQKLALAPASVG